MVRSRVPDEVVFRLPNAIGDRSTVAFKVDSTKRKRRKNSFQIRSRRRVIGTVNRISVDGGYGLDVDEVETSLYRWFTEEWVGKRNGIWWSRTYRSWNEYRPCNDLRMIVQGIVETYYREYSEGKSHGALDNMNNYLLKFKVPKYAGEEEYEKVSVVLINCSDAAQDGVDMAAKDMNDLYNLIFGTLMPEPPVPETQLLLAQQIREMESNPNIYDGKKLSNLKEEFKRNDCAFADDLQNFKDKLFFLRDTSPDKPRAPETQSTLRWCAGHLSLWHYERRRNLYGKMKDGYSRSKARDKHIMQHAVKEEAPLARGWYNKLSANHPFLNFYDDPEHGYGKREIDFVFFGRNLVRHISDKEPKPKKQRKEERKKKRIAEATGAGKIKKQKMQAKYIRDEIRDRDYFNGQFVERELRRVYPGLMLQLYKVLCFHDKYWRLRI